MPPPKKKIKVESVGGVIVSSRDGYRDWLKSKGVQCLKDDEGFEIADFESLVYGGTYTLGPPIQQHQHQQEDNILGEGVYEKLTGAVCFFRDNEGEQNPIGAGFAISETIVYSVAHNFADPAVDKEVTCHFGKPNHQTTRRLKIVSFDVRLDYCILSIVAGEACLPEFLEISSETLKTGRQCILAAFQIGLQQDLQDLDPELSIGVFKGEIAKLYPRHFVYQCPSFAGDSGGAVVLKSGKVIGIHQETVIQARERIRHGEDMDADARLQSVEASVDDLIRSLSSGSIGLQLSAIVRHDLAQGD